MRASFWWLLAPTLLLAGAAAAFMLADTREGRLAFVGSSAILAFATMMVVPLRRA